jgi:hypothetical protein
MWIRKRLREEYLPKSNTFRLSDRYIKKQKKGWEKIIDKIRTKQKIKDNVVIIYIKNLYIFINV